MAKSLIVVLNREINEWRNEVYYTRIIVKNTVTQYT